MATRIVVWNEFHHERENAAVGALYPEGIHGAIAGALRAEPDFAVSTATLDEPDHGLGAERLADTDVLFWWGHRRHGAVDDAAVERVAARVHQGMGLVMLHSGHFSKVFKRLTGAPCALRWREAGERERVWVVDPSHPIARGLPASFTLESSEMYGEPFVVPEPDETVFISWYEGGEVFRSGLTFRRGAGRIFYFGPGHETYPIYHDPHVRAVLRNAARWAHNPAPAWTAVAEAPNVPAERAPEPLKPRGPALHRPGEGGFR